MRRLGLLVGLGAALVALLVAGELVRHFAFSDRFSTFRGGELGAKALYLTVEGLGRPVRRLHEAPGRAGHQGVLFVLAEAAAAAALDRDEGEHGERLRWVEEGNTLVILHAADLGFLHRLGVRSAWPEVGTAAERVRLERGDPAAVTAAVPQVTARRPGSYHLDHGRYLALLGPADRPAAVLLGHGAGRLVLVSDPWPLGNAGLGEPGNLELALGLAALAGAGGVAFDETVHGFERDRSVVGYLRWRGLGPVLWQLGLVFAAAALVWASRERVEPAAAVPVGPGSGDYLDAMARVYAGADLDPAAGRDLAVELERAVVAETGGGRGAPAAAALARLAAVEPALAQAVGRAIAAGRSRPRRSSGLVGYHNRVMALIEALRARRTR
jgi:hypothetical protein